MKNKNIPFVALLVSAVIMFSGFSPAEKDSKDDWKTQVKKGWCVYSMQASDTSHVSQIKKHKPGMIRWFMEWDRFDYKKGGKSQRAARIATCKPFFKACAENKVTVCVQMWVKERLWAGDGTGGTQWAKPGKTLNYPADIDNSYGSFVRDLVAAMKAEGIDDAHIIMEAWNEADLLWGVGAHGVNYANPWKVFDKKGFAKWTGGSGEKWAALHHVLDKSDPGVKYASSSVGMWKEHESWIPPTYSANKVNYLDLHYYIWTSKSAGEYCDSLAKVIARWDKHLPNGQKPLPFFLGEIAHYSSGTEEQQKVTTGDAAMMREICSLLYNKYGDRFYGITCHAPINMWNGQYAWWDANYVRQ